MPLTPGHAQNLRLLNGASGGLGLAAPHMTTPPPDEDAGPSIGQDPSQDEPRHKGPVLRIENADLSVTISLDGSSLVPRGMGDNSRRRWFENLVEELEQSELGRISEELMRGVEDDRSSRKDWIETRANGIKLLALKVETPTQSGAGEGAPVEGMSTIRHPLLQEAVLRFQANAMAEMLPTDGPVKVRVDDNNGNVPEDRLADALEKDLNHFLTSTASEYYPDTDRMFLMLGFGGTSFKKVYYCPLRNRPASETVDANDLIVSEQATDLKNAKRVTHKLMMRPSVVRRMQLLGHYKDTPLSDPLPQDMDSVDRAKASQQGITPGQAKPEDRDREIWEIYCELNIKGLEYQWKGENADLDVPYRVTIDVSSRKILSIVRNYNQTDTLPEARVTFVKYTFVPGMGFHDIGLLNILGNATVAVTAAWRELLDTGMFANFPGFLMAKHASRQNETIFRVPPGGSKQIETNGMPIQDSVMALPYKTEGMPALQALADNIASTGQRIGGTSELQVGEGRPDAPVGTTLALIDQAVKVLNSVHKRMHSAQAQEFQLLVEVFKEHPEAFWQRKGISGVKWDEATFIAALGDYDLVPQADPNTASHAQRVLKVMGLKQLQQQSPQLYDPIAVDTIALQTLGWSNPQQFLAPPSALGRATPDAQAKLADLKIKAQEAATHAELAKAKGAELQAKIIETHAKVSGTGTYAPKGLGQGQGQPPDDKTPETMKAQAALIEAQTKARGLHVEAAETAAKLDDEDDDRHSREQLATMTLAREIMAHHDETGLKQGDLAIAAHEATKPEPEPKPPAKPRARKPKAKS